VPPESPTLGFTHLQFEALLTAARESPNPCDFALVAMLGLLGLLGLRIFEATSAKRSRSLHLPSPGHMSGSVSTYPGRCEVIQSLVAVVGMAVSSGMSNTSLRSTCSALGIT
jgi:hypothetical protein